MHDPEITIAGRPVGARHAPFVIAEIGSNYDQSEDKARRLIDAAAEAGADCVKFQLFRADALYPPGTELNALFKSVELNPDSLPVFAEHARQRGVLFSASVFDADSLRALLDVGVPLLKVASSETTNLPLLRAMAASGVPLLISTGMCELGDVDDAVTVSRGAGNNAICLMQCGAVYPLPPEDCNLRVLDQYVASFGVPVGFSDHTLGIAAPVAAVARGASVIEKHITLDRTDEGPDHSYALEPDDFGRMVDMIREAHAALGGDFKRMLPQERAHGRREGLHAARDLPAGTVLAEADMIEARPAVGVRARHRQAAVGARLGRAVAKGEPVRWEDLGK
ncbi:MAG: N-acetylneuraminate synthase family protein [Acetobacterales bacterium]